MSRIVSDEKMNIRKFCMRHLGARRLCLVGSGSSFYCAKMMAEMLMSTSGLQIQVFLPSEAERFFPQAEDVILMITQEGKSVNVLRAANHFEKIGAQFCVMTAAPDSPTAGRAQDCLDLGCGEELCGPKTMGVMATLTCLTLLGLEWGYCSGYLTQSAYADGTNALNSLIANMDQNIASSRKWATENETFFLDASFVSVLSNSPLCALGCEGALKWMETLYIPSVSYEFEEFIHGPHCLIGNSLHVIALYHGLEGEDRLKALCGFAREKGANVLEISDQQEGKEFNGLRLIGSGDKVFPMAFLLPFQAAAAYLAERMGHDLNHSKFPGFATRLKSKLY